MKSYKSFAQYAVNKYSLDEIANAVSAVSDEYYFTSIHDMVETLGMTGHDVFLAFNMSREMSLLDYYGKNYALYTLDAYNAFEKIDPVDVVEEMIFAATDKEKHHDSELYAWYLEYCNQENQ